MRTLRFLQEALFSAAMLLAAAAASAAPIELFIPSPDRVGVPGETLTFAGTVTNHWTARDRAAVARASRLLTLQHVSEFPRPRTRSGSGT